MDVKEIRLGNFINVEQTTHLISHITPYSVGSFWIEDFKKTELYTNEHCEIKPIPLTEEWLLKLGFKRQLFDHENNKDYNKGTFIIQYHTEVNDFICCNTNPNFVSLKYVHQLQNLYFALTGKELTLKYGKEKESKTTSTAKTETIK